MSRINEVINTLKSYGLQSGKEEYHKDINLAIKMLEHYEKHCDEVTYEIISNPPKTTSGIPGKAIKKIVSVRHITNSFSSSLETSVLKAVNKMQDDGEEVEVQYQQGNNCDRVLLIGRK